MGALYYHQHCYTELTVSKRIEQAKKRKDDSCCKWIECTKTTPAFVKCCWVGAKQQRSSLISRDLRHLCKDITVGVCYEGETSKGQLGCGKFVFFIYKQFYPELDLNSSILIPWRQQIKDQLQRPLLY